MRYFIFFNIIIVMSCDEYCQKIEFKNFERQNQPPIYILDQLSDCSYKIDCSINTNLGALKSTGLLHVRSDAFEIVLDDPQTSAIKIFDFRKEQGEEYDAVFYIRGRKGVLQLKLVNKFKRYGSIVYAFRLRDGYLAPGRHYYDVMFFVSEGKGIIGSYMTYQWKNKEIISAPRGDILRGFIDYSDKEFRLIM